MKNQFQSVAEICDHLNGLDSIKASISNDMTFHDGINAAVQLTFVSVSKGQNGALWRFTKAEGENVAPSISVGTIYAKEEHPVDTPVQLMQAVDVLTHGFKP